MKVLHNMTEAWRWTLPAQKVDFLSLFFRVLRAGASAYFDVLCAVACFRYRGNLVTLSKVVDSSPHPCVTRGCSHVSQTGATIALCAQPLGESVPPTPLEYFVVPRERSINDGATFVVAEIDEDATSKISASLCSCCYIQRPVPWHAQRSIRSPSVPKIDDGMNSL